MLCILIDRHELVVSLGVCPMGIIMKGAMGSRRQNPSLGLMRRETSGGETKEPPSRDGFCLRLTVAPLIIGGHTVPPARRKGSSMSRSSALSVHRRALGRPGYTYPEIGN